MRKLTATFILAIIFLGRLPAQENFPKLGKSSIDEVISAMTLEEKAGLLVGDHEFEKYKSGQVSDKVPGIAGTTMPISRLGITATYETDGPAGINLETEREGDAAKYRCTAFPVASLLACTWDADLVGQVGEAIGNEAFEYGCDVVLAPAINIHRNPLCGRNFEYYSEDPYVTGKIAAAMIKGIQSQNVGTSVKHFAANSQETFRRENDSRISQRALREIYLKGFEIAVKEAHPWTIMSSYNKINGVWTQEDYPLLTEILRNEWGFNGIVMSDWTRQLRNTPAQIHAGNELLMPGFQGQIDDIVASVKNGRLSEKDLDLAVRRMLEFIMRTPTFKDLKYSCKPDLAAHEEITRRSASEGMVLLKNDSQCLPLKGNDAEVALFGLGSYDLLATGSGSGNVTGSHVISVSQGLENAGFHIQKVTKAMYSDAQEEYPVSASFAGLCAESADVAIVTLRRNAGEYSDRHDTEGDFLLTSVERKMLENVSKAFHSAGKKVVVVLNIGGVMETASWKGLADAILLAWQPGVEGGNSIADILDGKVNPSGKLTMTFPVDYFDVPSSSNFPYDYYGDSWRKDWKSFDPYKKNIGYTNYDEGIWIGYRYFSTKGVPVSFPFGFGLSYTSFDYGKASVRKDGSRYRVSVDIKNTGSVSGKEVVEMYLSAPSGGIEKPVRELKAFAKTKELAPGETQTIVLYFTPYEMSSFDESLNGWKAEAGEYKVCLGSSVEDIRQELEFKLPKAYVQKVYSRL